LRISNHKEKREGVKPYLVPDNSYERADLCHCYLRE
jgi:hypothetical protein